MEHVSTPHHVRLTLTKFGPGQNPETDAPEDTVVREQWFEGDGTEVTDPDRIAELEATRGADDRIP